jgi:Fe-S cluster assembly ATP-binding protein
MLVIKDLYAKVKDSDKEIIKGLNLEIKENEIHVIMGPNGAGKSTLSNIIFNNPKYEITKGDILFEGEKINDLKPNEIAKKGIFMSFQIPEVIPGITNAEFLKSAKTSITGEKVNLFEFANELDENMDKLNINKDYINREVNVGFSGGEKKKNEILQMLTLNPKLAILDETDSGLDVDAIKTVSKGIEMFKNDENAVLIITHNTKILHSLKVDKVHILVDGKIVDEGDQDLASVIEQFGYTSYKKEN